jgi:hypothetical protein
MSIETENSQVNEYGNPPYPYPPYNGYKPQNFPKDDAQYPSPRMNSPPPPGSYSRNSFSQSAVGNSNVQTPPITSPMNNPPYATQPVNPTDNFPYQTSTNKPPPPPGSYSRNSFSQSAVGNSNVQTPPYPIPLMNNPPYTTQPQNPTDNFPYQTPTNFLPKETQTGSFPSNVQIAPIVPYTIPTMNNPEYLPYQTPTNFLPKETQTGNLPSTDSMNSSEKIPFVPNGSSLNAEGHLQPKRHPKLPPGPYQHSGDISNNFVYGSKETLKGMTFFFSKHIL